MKFTKKNKDIIIFAGIFIVINLLELVIFYVIFNANSHHFGIMFEWFWFMIIGLIFDIIGVIFLVTPIIKFDLSRYEQVKSNFAVEEILYDMLKKSEGYHPRHIITREDIVTQVDLALKGVVLTRTIFEIYQDAKKNKKYAFIGIGLLISGFSLMIISILMQVKLLN